MEKKKFTKFCFGVAWGFVFVWKGDSQRNSFPQSEGDIRYFPFRDRIGFCSPESFAPSNVVIP